MSDRFQFGDNPSGDKMLKSRLEFYGIFDAWDLVQYGIDMGWIHNRPHTQELMKEELRRARSS